MQTQSPTVGKTFYLQQHLISNVGTVLQSGFFIQPTPSEDHPRVITITLYVFLFIYLTKVGRKTGWIINSIFTYCMLSKHWQTFRFPARFSWTLLSCFDRLVLFFWTVQTPALLLLYLFIFFFFHSTLAYLSDWRFTMVGQFIPSFSGLKPFIYPSES